jgi:hypothetical protein
MKHDRIVAEDGPHSEHGLMKRAQFGFYKILHLFNEYLDLWRFAGRAAR